MYKMGEGVPVNYAKAKEYYEKAMELGDESVYSNYGTLFEKLASSFFSSYFLANSNNERGQGVPKGIRIPFSSASILF